MLVEEIPKTSNANSNTIYFSSLINLLARPTSLRHSNLNSTDDGDGTSRGSKNRPKVNYNLTDLANKSIGNDSGSGLKSQQLLQLEKLITKRLTELHKESSVPFEIPKNLSFHGGGKAKARPGNTPTTKRIISARRNLNLYFEEEKDYLALNAILTRAYQFADPNDGATSQKVKKQKSMISTKRAFKPKLKLCCICGNKSDYTRCFKCGLFSCSVRCNKVHVQLRCN
ncbi:uncharacterized protein KQ657_000733 [Scheffersomyces spartinae]|uniref:HIT-type domain-containing protein n=1 Tax=Scheffersomyces spartinae TaxID=45513 RepID=A0A9P8AI71_9ASCO|nr:uncharacterized protein KQ657_000733 [Scheffersomyces spartinae]KAG7193319.1 hypothetical protein KQ657_000733 [Scheffersomyces spartinae]